MYVSNVMFCIKTAQIYYSLLVSWTFQVAPAVQRSRFRRPGLPRVEGIGSKPQGASQRLYASSRGGRRYRLYRGVSDTRGRAGFHVCPYIR